MGNAEVIAREAGSLPLEKQAEILDFIAFLTMKESEKQFSAPKTVEEIEAFFRCFKVTASGYTFDREDANAR